MPPWSHPALGPVVVQGCCLCEQLCSQRLAPSVWPRSARLSIEPRSYELRVTELDLAGRPHNLQCLHRAQYSVEWIRGSVVMGVWHCGGVWSVLAAPPPGCGVGIHKWGCMCSLAVVSQHALPCMQRGPKHSSAHLLLLCLLCYGCIRSSYVSPAKIDVSDVSVPTDPIGDAPLHSLPIVPHSPHPTLTYKRIPVNTHLFQSAHCVR